MRTNAAVLVIGFAALQVPYASTAGALEQPRETRDVVRGLQFAQATDAPTTEPSVPSMPGTDPSATPTPGPALPTLAQPSPQSPAPAPPQTTGPQTGSASAPTGPTSPASGGTVRNGSGSSLGLAPPGSGPTPVSPSSSTFGGPQTPDLPIYGSATRDPGTANAPTATLNGVPSTIGGPINGTAILPSKVPSTESGSTASSLSGPTNRLSGTTFNQQPLGSAPLTRDQFGTFGGRNGYNAQGIYNGTAAQSTGFGYGSVYAPNGRPVGGLLSTNVDATGPLRPYMPINPSPLGRPNSGYGIPNGSQPTQMDGRGVQRLR